MRIIAGMARGKRLETLKGDATRPTLERVKEGIFSAVQFWLPGARVLDLFAGSGQLGLEALSRGAAGCVFVDDNRLAAAVVRRNIQAAGFEAESRVRQTNALAFLASGMEKFDLILLDPPYGTGLLETALEKVSTVCAPNAQVVCESAVAADLPERVGGLKLEKTYRYGTVKVSRYCFESLEND